MRAFIALLSFASFAPAFAAPPAGAAACSGCHAASSAVAAPLPRLAGRDPADIVNAMREFREGRRAATVMDRIAKGFTEDETRAIAAWVAGQR